MPALPLRRRWHPGQLSARLGLPPSPPRPRRPTWCPDAPRAWRPVRPFPPAPQASASEWPRGAATQRAKTQTATLWPQDNPPGILISAYYSMSASLSSSRRPPGIKLKKCFLAPCARLWDAPSSPLRDLAPPCFCASVPAAPATWEAHSPSRWPAQPTLNAQAGHPGTILLRVGLCSAIY